jgi:ATP-dependent Clp protease adaptor protein ClpS
MKDNPKYFNNQYGDTNIRELIMYDSDRHTFDEAINSIWLVTGYEEMRCEQLALLIHTKGRTCIKMGEVEDLIPMLEILIEAGFKVDIK